MIYKIIIINGVLQSGKNTFSKHIKEAAKLNNIFVIDISTVDKVKEAAKILGWNPLIKEPNDRKFLSDLKDLSMRYNNGPFNYIIDKINNLWQYKSRAIFFIHCREPEEIKKLKNYYKHNCITLLIERPNYNPVISNHADQNVYKFDYDYKIINNFDYTFKNKALEFYEKILGE